MCWKRPLLDAFITVGKQLERLREDPEEGHVSAQTNR